MTGGDIPLFCTPHLKVSTRFLSGFLLYTIAETNSTCTSSDPNKKYYFNDSFSGIVEEDIKHANFCSEIEHLYFLFPFRKLNPDMRERKYFALIHELKKAFF